MKRKMAVLIAILLCIAVVATMGVLSAADTVPMEKLWIYVDLSETELASPKEVEVTITVRNMSDEDRPGPLTLYYPDGTQINEFGAPTLKANEVFEWKGTWFVTQNQLDAGKVRFGVRYTGLNSLGIPVTKEGYVAAGVISLDAGEGPTSPVLAMVSNTTTGFDWHWEIDNEEVVSVNKTYVADMYYDVPDMIPPVGGGGRTRIQLNGLTPGDATVIFQYKRVWREDTPIREIICRVRVDEALNVTILSSIYAEFPDSMFLTEQ